MIGVLGGMGPIATIDLLQKIRDLTPAERDQDHLPVIVHDDPRIPDRSLAIADPAAPSPLPALLRGVRNLEICGARCIAIPCNTAHFWLAQLQMSTSLPILNMIEIASGVIRSQLRPGTGVGILATAGTIVSRLYHEPLEKAGLHCISLPERLTRDCINLVIAAVKRNRPHEAVDVLHSATRTLIDGGAAVIVLGCTELPVCWKLCAPGVLPPGIEVVDPTLLLAGACVRWALRSPGASTAGR